MNSINCGSMSVPVKGYFDNRHVCKSYLELGTCKSEHIWFNCVVIKASFLLPRFKSKLTQLRTVFDVSILHPSHVLVPL